MLTIEQLNEMLKLQEQLEIRISGDNWRNASHNYPLCIYMECAEIIDHYGWKHWKDIGKAPDTDAIAMELVDVWHFVMAFMMTFEDFNAENMHMQLLEAVDKYKNEPKRDMITLCIGMAYSIFATGKFPYGNFVGIMHIADMSFDDLYKLYISKNVLNWFRQDNGYKEGHYNKNWGGKEDNEHLQELCDNIGDDLTAELLYHNLKLRYNLVH